MTPEISIAYMTVDTSPAAELAHVSPIFFRSGPRLRGAYPESRLARTRRTDARRAMVAGSTAAAADAAWSSRGRIGPRDEDIASSAPATVAVFTRRSDAIPGNTSDLRRRFGR